MDLKGIVSISGRPGVFKIISQGKNSAIVESLLDQKRSPIFASEKMSAIEEISIYTLDEDIKLTIVFEKLLAKHAGKESISHKADEAELRANFSDLLPNYDIERVYLSDIKKVFQWYNLLVNKGLLMLEKEPTQNSSEVDPKDNAEVTTEGKKTSKGEKISTTKSTKVKKTVKAATPKANVAKPTVSKKAPVVKTGSSRGK